MILDDLTNVTKVRIAKEKAALPLDDLKKQINYDAITYDFPFETALRKPKMSFICEIKRASPSKGDIKTKIDVEQLAKAYQQAETTAISVLTEPDYFKGTLADLQQVTGAVDVPVLRKDFTVDPYMIYQAKTAGASVILLICAILDDNQLHEYFEIANQLGLSVIFEAHNETEIKRAIAAGARIIGINNRNLKNFTVNMDNSKQLRELVPDDILFISESGIKSHAEIAELEAIGVNGALIGETMMLADDKAQKLKELAHGQN
ncbi:indole-3-glycerol phosphate synthase TrpC [Fructilactobacillus sp. Tb1]|uniref:indole-3-glycerol phosphate synthase TrpC n=1 Tax=Fructilactobacillus sp. Tb1 TaxID=3422304 RepID=UPI003D2D0D99